MCRNSFGRNLSEFRNNRQINGGVGDDYISNNGDSVSIDGGEGNDSIYNDGDYSTVDGGVGNDSIYNSGSNVLIKYASGDGNDVIIGVGDDSIALKDASTLATVNIDGEEISEDTWKLDGTTATYSNSITVTGVKSLDGISLNNKVITISAAALKQGTVTVSNGYTLALGSDVSKPSTSAAHFDGLTYKSESTTEGYTLSNNQIVYTPEVKATRACW